MTSSFETNDLVVCIRDDWQPRGLDTDPAPRYADRLIIAEVETESPFALRHQMAFVRIAGFDGFFREDGFVRIEDATDIIRKIETMRTGA